MDGHSTPARGSSGTAAGKVRKETGTKQNCWEFKKCGREPGGVKAAELGVCPAATDNIIDGTNGGKNGGRFCWAVAGTLSEGKAQGTFARDSSTCLICDFFKQAKEEEAEKFVLSMPAYTAGRLNEGEACG